MKKTAICLLLSICLILAGCNNGTMMPFVAGSESHPPTVGKLRVTTILPAEANYLQGQNITIKIEFSNIGDITTYLKPFPPRTISIKSPDGETVYVFPPGINEMLRLDPGNKRNLTLSWDQVNVSGNRVAPGYYFVDVGRVSDESEDVDYVKIGDSRIYIEYPQGTVEKIIEPNESRTVGNITITLERVELSSQNGSSFRFFVNPPSYSYAPSQLLTGDINTSAYATYSFDGITRDIGLTVFKPRVGGIDLTWGAPERLLEPVPGDAKELVFTITRFCNTDGVWEFNVPLQ